jgi:hypothetical protein
MILAGDHLKLRLLPAHFVADGGEYIGVGAFEFVEHAKLLSFNGSTQLSSLRVMFKPAVVAWAGTDSFEF